MDVWLSYLAHSTPIIYPVHILRNFVTNTLLSHLRTFLGKVILAKIWFVKKYFFCMSGWRRPLEGLAPGAILGCPQYKAAGDKALHLFRPAPEYSTPNTVYSVQCTFHSEQFTVYGV